MSNISDLNGTDWNDTDWNGTNETTIDEFGFGRDVIFDRKLMWDGKLSSQKYVHCKNLHPLWNISPFILAGYYCVIISALLFIYWMTNIKNANAEDEKGKQSRNGDGGRTSDRDMGSKFGKHSADQVDGPVIHFGDTKADESNSQG